MPDSPAYDDSASDYPTARVAELAAGRRLAGAAVSRLWWVTALCLVAAGLLVWSQFSGQGRQIEIRFADGHGLKPGDAVRFRGIVVGQVEQVQLADEMESVKVEIQLAEQADALAREGTRFWIERPDVRIGSVRGLDTLLGSRYVSVAPGPPDAAPGTRFQGLEDAPDYLHGFGDELEIVLECTHRRGLQPGSQVSYRGIPIGTVQSVGLANDSATVLSRALIRSKYRPLVCEKSRFWITSGFDLRLGLQGLEFNAETLATVAAGGVAMATPQPTGRPVTTGHRFELAESPQSKWTQWQPRVAIGSASLPPGVATPAPVLAIRREPGGAWEMFSSTRQRGWLLPLEGGRVLGPSQLLVGDHDDARLELLGKEFALDSEGVEVGELLAVRTLAEPFDNTVTPWPEERIDSLTQPQDVLVTCGSDEKTMPLAAERITFSDGPWTIEAGVPIDASWLGACVVTASEGRLVGIVTEQEEQMVIAPVPEKLVVP